MWSSVYIVCPSVLSYYNLRLHQTLKVKNIFKQENVMLQLTFNPGLTLTGFQTTRPRRRVEWKHEITTTCMSLRRTFCALADSWTVKCPVLCQLFRCFDPRFTERECPLPSRFRHQRYQHLSKQLLSRPFKIQEELSLL